MNVITPAEIRSIRETLGLSQRAAGEILGGGPSAFSKYENGAVEPAASLVALLRILEANPSALEHLAAPTQHPILRHETSPFEVTARHVEALDDRTLPALARRLLNAEAQVYQLPNPDIHIPSNHSAPDGGEDGRIEWEGGPARTFALPARFVQFQFKAGTIGPTRAAKDVLTSSGTLKHMVAAAVDAGAHYAMMCAATYTGTAIQKRETAIRDAFSAAGCIVDPSRIRFRDAEYIAHWANRHPSVAVWLKERTEPGTTGPFRSLDHWSDRSEHAQSPWIADERLDPLRKRLLERIDKPRGIFRVLGAASVGKTRLTLEALGSSPDDAGLRSSLVLYADRAETDPVTINDVVRNLADTGARAIVVVDGCPPDAHRMLSRLVAKSTSQLSLVTIDIVQDPADGHSPDTLVLDDAPEAVTAGILDRALPTLPSEDRRRLLLFARGYPGIAFRVASAWDRSAPVPYSADAHFVDAFVCGPHDPSSLIPTAKLLAAFGLIRDQTGSGHVDEIASRGGIGPAEFRAQTMALVGRRVVQRRGGFYALQPRPVAMNLALRQWRQWSQADWEDVLAGDGAIELRVNAARQLAWLNTTDVAADVVRHVCRLGGSFTGSDRLARQGAAQVVFHLAAVNPRSCAELIRYAFEGIPDLGQVGGDLRRYLVETLQRIAFDPSTFAEAAELLLRLAEAENEPQIANNATGQFAALFPILLGDTAADGESRIAFLSDVADSDERRRAVVVKGLLAGIKTSHFSRFVGAESQGSRPALVPWRPHTRDELRRYIRACLDCLVDAAICDEPCGVEARDGLAIELRMLVFHGFIDDVERIVEQVRCAVGPWRAAIESLGHFLEYDVTEATDPDLSKRVEALIEGLQPNELGARVRYLVTHMPWDYPNGENLDFEVRAGRQASDIEEIAAEVTAHAEVLRDLLPDLTAGSQRMAAHFGRHIAPRVDSPSRWLVLICESIIHTPEDQRDFGLLAGFLRGVEDPTFVSDAKAAMARTAELAAGLPLVCSTLGLVATDIDLAIQAIEEGLLPAQRLSQWTLGGALSALAPEDVAPLFDVLLDLGPETLKTAVELVGMYAHGNPDQLERLREQIHTIIECAAKHGLTLCDTMGDHLLQTIIEWLLAKGRADADARRAALSLTRALTTCEVGHQAEHLVTSLLRILLADFPEIVWPLLGHAIVRSDAAGTWKLQHLLEGRQSIGDGDQRPPLLSLPTDTLFAWCEAHPDVAPAFVAEIIPFLAADGARDDLAYALDPIYGRLLDEFGHCKGVLDAASANIRSFGWSGSLTTYYARYRTAVDSLGRHARPQVARWARRMLAELDKNIDRARHDDEEQAVQWEV